MRADVVQAVSICCYGNAYLAGGDPEAAPELLSANSTFKSTHEVLFERRGTGFAAQTSGKVAVGTAPWLRRLRAEGVERLQLCLAKCALVPSDQGEDPWGITADGDLGLEIWQPAWKARVLGGYSDSSPWKVTYSGERFSRWALPTIKSPVEASAELRQATRRTADFCTKKGVPKLSLALERLIALGDEGNADLLAFPDLCPGVYTDAAQRLFAAALRTMLVMGSPPWSPASFDDKADGAGFKSHSDQLWRSVTAALEAGAMAMGDSPAERSTAA